MANIETSKATFVCPHCKAELIISLHLSTQERFVFIQDHNNCNANYVWFLHELDRREFNPHNQSDESFIKFALDHYEQNKTMYALEDF